MSIQSVRRAVSGIENTSFDCHTTIIQIDNVCITHIPQSIKIIDFLDQIPEFSLTVRDREPSRISLRKIMQSLKCKKLRRKLKIMLKKTAPVSSVWYLIASN